MEVFSGAMCGQVFLRSAGAEGRVHVKSPGERAPRALEGWPSCAECGEEEAA